MSSYFLLKHIHMAAAYLTITMFVGRLLMDAAGWPGWRRTALRWIPHVNDTILLVAAIGLLFITGWLPLVHHWLTLKVLLLVGYIVVGKFALKPTLHPAVRVTAGTLAIVQVMSIVYLALTKPIFI